MKILMKPIAIDDLKQMAGGIFVDMIKAVVDVDRKMLAIDAELHSDLEALLLENGSKQKYLWGINLYPDTASGEFIEYDSMINVRPSQGNKSRGVEDQTIRQNITGIVAHWITR